MYILRAALKYWPILYIFLYYILVYQHFLIGLKPMIILYNSVNDSSWLKSSRKMIWSGQFHVYSKSQCSYRCIYGKNLECNVYRPTLQ